MPLSHLPGHAQCDFGEALVIIGGVEQKAHCFVLDLPHSDGCFVKAYPAETTEAFLDGHVSAFAFLGGVPRSILYDNTKLAVARILGDGRRKRTRAFTELQSHYLFDDRFGRPGKGNDKGKVEGMVGYMRRNFLVPVPSDVLASSSHYWIVFSDLDHVDYTLAYATSGAEDTDYFGSGWTIERTARKLASETDWTSNTSHRLRVGFWAKPN